MLVKMCFILLSLSRIEGSTLIDISKVREVRKQVRKYGYCTPYTYVSFSKDSFSCVKETPEQILRKIEEECK